MISEHCWFSGEDRELNIATAILRHIVPLSQDVNGVPECAGTGLLTSYCGESFLITAAHVLDKANKVGSNVYFYAGLDVKQKLHGLTSLSRLEPGQARDTDLVDIGAVPLPQSLAPPYTDVNKYSFSLEHAASFRFPRSQRTFLIVGFPRTRRKINRPARIFSTKPLIFINRSQPASLYADLGVSEVTHIAMAYDAKQGFHYDGTHENLPDPDGMSGSPIWELVDVGQGMLTPRLVGILTTKPRHKKTLLATDIGAVIRMLDDRRRVPNGEHASAQPGSP